MFSGVSPDRTLVEFVELPREVHPFYVGTQAHPELRSRPNRAHPLFAVSSARARAPARRAVCSSVGDDDVVPSPIGDAASLRDESHPVDRSVSSRARLRRARSGTFDGSDVRATATARSCREFVDHPGRSRCSRSTTTERVLLIQQYRHPIGERDWELPAGLLDVAGEDPAVAARPRAGRGGRPRRRFAGAAARRRSTPRPVAATSRSASSSRGISPRPPRPSPARTRRPTSVVELGPARRRRRRRARRAAAATRS